MRLFRFVRDMAYIACMVTAMFFQLAAEMSYAGYRRIRRTIALVGLSPAAVPYLMRLDHLAWRLRSAPYDPWPNRVHRMRIACGIRNAKCELCTSRRDGGQGVAGWRIRMMGH